MPRLDITFDRPKPVYKPGEVVSGSATFTLEEPLTVRGREVTISLTGTAHASFKEEFVYDREPKTFSESETLVSSTDWPVVRLMGDTILVMPRGQHVFRFSFTIPMKTLDGAPLPGQYKFKSDDGEVNISYFVKAQVSRSAVRFDLEEEREIIIADYYDLNEDILASSPIEVTEGKTIQHWCCGSGRIQITARLPKSGYAMGEFIGLWLEISNQSAKTIKMVHVRLTEWRMLKASGKLKLMSSTLVERSKEQPVLPGHTQFWMNEGFRVPRRAKPSPCGRSCRIIDFSHNLDIEVVLQGDSLEFPVIAGIHIGTVPLVKPKPKSMPALPFCA